jgi:hypothetical protein
VLGVEGVNLADAAVKGGGEMDRVLRVDGALAVHTRSRARSAMTVVTWCTWRYERLKNASTWWRSSFGNEGIGDCFADPAYHDAREPPTAHREPDFEQAERPR